LLAVQHGPQNLFGRLFVLVLRPTILDADGGFGGNMGTNNSRFGLVTMLPAFPRPSAGLDQKVFFQKEKLLFRRFFKDGNRYGRSLNSAVSFGRRNALPAVPASFVLED
jgi:hypothetical protein